MSIKIKIKQNKIPRIIKSKLLHPREAYGSDHGTVFQIVNDGKLDNVYLIGAGFRENPIVIFWESESKQYMLSSDSEQDLNSYSEYIQILKITTNIKIEIE